MKNSNANTVPAVLTFTSLASTVRPVRRVAAVASVKGTKNVWTIVEAAYVQAAAVQSGVAPEELHMVSLVRSDRVPSF